MIRTRHGFVAQNYRTEFGMGRFVGRHGVVAPQRENELLELLYIIDTCKVKSYLEIGLERGVTFHTVAMKLPAGATCVGVDKPHDAIVTGGPELIGTFCAELVQQDRQPTIIWGNSRDPGVIHQVQALGPYDLMLIDGDHTYEGVLADWQNYGPLGRIVAFHDVTTDWEPEVCGVAQLWALIRDKYPDRWLELHGAPEAFRPGMGIGLYFRDGLPG